MPLSASVLRSCGRAASTAARTEAWADTNIAWTWLSFRLSVTFSGPRPGGLQLELGHLLAGLAHVQHLPAQGLAPFAAADFGVSAAWLGAGAAGWPEARAWPCAGALAVPIVKPWAAEGASAAATWLAAAGAALTLTDAGSAASLAAAMAVALGAPGFCSTRVSVPASRVASSPGRSSRAENGVAWPASDAAAGAMALPAGRSRAASSAAGARAVGAETGPRSLVGARAHRRRAGLAARLLRHRQPGSHRWRPRWRQPVRRQRSRLPPRPWRVEGRWRALPPAAAAVPASAPAALAMRVSSGTNSSAAVLIGFGRVGFFVVGDALDGHGGGRFAAGLGGRFAGGRERARQHVAKTVAVALAGFIAAAG